MEEALIFWPHHAHHRGSVPCKKENEIPNAVCGFGKAAYVKDLTLNIIRRK